MAGKPASQQAALPAPHLSVKPAGRQHARPGIVKTCGRPALIGRDACGIFPRSSACWPCCRPLSVQRAANAERGILVRGHSQEFRATQPEVHRTLSWSSGCALRSRRRASRRRRRAPSQHGQSRSRASPGPTGSPAKKDAVLASGLADIGRPVTFTKAEDRSTTGENADEGGDAERHSGGYREGGHAGLRRGRLRRSAGTHPCQPLRAGRPTPV